jgi:hypothetical protein
MWKKTVKQADGQGGRIREGLDAKCRVGFSMQKKKFKTSDQTAR